MTIDSPSIDTAPAARPVQRERQAPAVTFTRNADGLPEVEVDLSFWDLLDIVNPLHHIPVVGHIYRAVSGDEIHPSTRVMGGILYGGVLGGAAAVANAVVEQSTGKDMGDHVLASLGFGDAEPASGPPIQIAAATPRPAASTPAPTTAIPNSAAPNAALAATTAPNIPAPAAQAANAAVPAPETRPVAAGPVRLAAAVPETRVPESRPADTTVRTALASPIGDHRPTRMPTRDTVPANTLQARHAAMMSSQQLARFGTPVPAAAGPAAPGVPASAAAGPSFGPDGAAAVSPATLPDVMMRNLAKYEQAKRAAAMKPTAGLRLSG